MKLPPSEHRCGDYFTPTPLDNDRACRHKATEKVAGWWYCAKHAAMAKRRLDAVGQPAPPSEPLQSPSAPVCCLTGTQHQPRM